VKKSFRVKSLLFGLCAGFAMQAHALEPDVLTVTKMAPADAYRVYIADPNFSSLVDGRMHVIDGQNMHYLGMVSTGFSGLSVLSPDRSELYVATTYYARLNHGERTDVVDIHDATTLARKEEIVIPPRHAQGTASRSLIQTSFDGSLLYVQNATPATSVTVVDLRNRKVLAEVPTPGCWAVYPSPTVASRFSAMCGNGSMLTLTLDEAGQVATRKQSAPFFDPDSDPVFPMYDRNGDKFVFVSFHGKVYQADLSGEMASVEPGWSLVGAADAKAGWRPGGYQLLATERAAGRLYVAMHDKGEEGSHKNPAKEIWVIDLASHKRIARMPGHNAVSMATSRGDKPRLYLLDATNNDLIAYDLGAKPKLFKRMPAIGNTPIHLELQ